MKTMSRVIVIRHVPRRCCKSFSTKAKELVQQTTAVNAEKQVELDEAGALRKVLRLKLRSPDECAHHGIPLLSCKS